MFGVRNGALQYQQWCRFRTIPITPWSSIEIEITDFIAHRLGGGCNDFRPRKKIFLNYARLRVGLIELLVKKLSILGQALPLCSFE
jgi:hypothetical protein